MFVVQNQNAAFLELTLLWIYALIKCGMLSLIRLNEKKPKGWGHTMNAEKFNHKGKTLWVVTYLILYLKSMCFFVYWAIQKLRY